jgi:hypothetical protein
LDDIPRALQESKVLLKVAILVAGGAAMLWGGIGALKKWIQSSNDHADPIGTDEKFRSQRLGSYLPSCPRT